MKTIFQIFFLIFWIVSAKAQIVKDFEGRTGVLSWTAATKNTDGSPITNKSGYLVGYHPFADSEEKCRPPDKIRYFVDIGTLTRFPLLSDPNFRINGKYYVSIFTYTIGTENCGGFVLDVPGQPKKCVSEPFGGANGGLCLKLIFEMDNGPKLANSVH